jgi:hypothetical protein
MIQPIDSKINYLTKTNDRVRARVLDVRKMMSDTDEPVKLAGVKNLNDY